jgi:hypothetical protein
MSKMDGEKWGGEKCINTGPGYVGELSLRSSFILSIAIMLLRLVSLLCVSASAALAAPSSQPSGCPSSGEGKQAPVVTVKNGSYVGVHNSYYNQDFFLGVPYAQVRLSFSLFGWHINALHMLILTATRQRPPFPHPAKLE